MIQIEPWMVRTALVILTLFVLDGVMYVWLQRRKSMESRSPATEFPLPREDDRGAIAEPLEHQARIRIEIA